MTAPSQVTRRDIGLRSERGPILLGVMLTTGLVAIDSTILATAVPAVVDDLGGFSQFPWLFSVYLLAQAVSVPIYGKLADQLGRKPILMVGIGLFLAGSLLCGLAWGMVPLIVFRTIQGLGAGAVQPIGMTIVGDTYSMAERAKVAGYISSVWAVASLVGPTLGGVFSDYLSWRWIFFVNLPLGLLAAWLIHRSFRERVERQAHTLDARGALLLALGGTLLLLGLLEGGQSWSWASPVSVTIFVAAALLLLLFVFVERSAAEPVLPLWVFRRRVLNAANSGSLIVGLIMLGLSSYVPLFAQGVLDTGALVAGLALAAMTIGWPIAASNSGRLYLTVGFRATTFTGAIAVVIGGALLVTVDANSSLWRLALPCFIMGLGFGLVASPSTIAAQSSVGWQDRGVVTAANMFGRSVGSALGVAIFGAIANGIVRSRTGGTPTSLEQVPVSDLEPALHAVFVAAAAVAVLLLVAALTMPKRVVPPPNDGPAQSSSDSSR
jgi:EmrB/QacA subfamily drug resistance transporter